MTDATKQTKWDPQAEPFRVTFIYSTNQPGLHGWCSRSYTFETLDQALAVVAMPFRARTQYAEVTVAKNRKTWNQPHPVWPDSIQGYFEPVGKRYMRKSFKWSKGWSPKRAQEVERYLTKKGVEW